MTTQIWISEFRIWGEQLRLAARTPRAPGKLALALLAAMTLWFNPKSKIRNLKSKIPSTTCRNYAIHYPAPMREDLFTRLATLTELTRNLQVSL
jgi:hypothetical protein